MGLGGVVCLCLFNPKSAWSLLLTDRGSNETSIWTIRKLWSPLHGSSSLPRTSSEWPHGKEGEVGIDSHMASCSGRLLAAPSCTCNKGSVWYAPPTGTHAENMGMATGMLCDGQIPVHHADNAAGVACYRGEPRKNALFPSGPTVSLKTSTRRCLLWCFHGYSMSPWGFWPLGRNITTSVLWFLCQHLCPAPYGHVLRKKILYIYIYKKCRYFYIFCMVLLKTKFLCIFYIYTDLLNLIIGNQLKRCFDIFYMNIAQFYLNLAFDK